MEIEKAIIKLKRIVDYCENNKECQEHEFCSDCYIEIEDVKAIQTVLNELENKNQEEN